MAEIYRDKTGLGVTLDIPGASVTKVVFKRGDVETPASAGLTVSIPYAITHMDGPFQVEWTYTLEGNEYVRVDSHRVVTPLFDAGDLADDPQLSTLSDSQVKKLEGLVRRIIEAYTGQSFGYREGYVDAYGRGDDFLLVPERIVSLDDTGYRAISGGYAIRPATGGYGDFNIKVPADEEALYYGYRTKTFSNNVSFRVHGTFGWATVPEDVKDAALLLAEEFSCDESMWRDRYIKSIRAADWRFDFADGAYSGTGSLSADQLLAKYVINRVVVI